MEPCEKYLEAILGAAEKAEADVRLSSELSAHLPGCANCAGALEELRQTIREFREVPVGKPRADLAERALKAIGRQEQERGTRGRKGSRLALLWSAAAAVLLVATLLTVFWLHRPGRADGTLTAVTEKQAYHGKAGPDDRGVPPKVYYAIEFRLSGTPRVPSSFFDVVRDGRKVGYGEVTVLVSEEEREGRAWALPGEKIQPGDGIVLRAQKAGE